MLPHKGAAQQRPQGAKLQLPGPDNWHKAYSCLASYDPDAPRAHHEAPKSHTWSDLAAAERITPAALKSAAAHAATGLVLSRRRVVVCSPSGKPYGNSP